MHGYPGPRRCVAYQLTCFNLVLTTPYLDFPATQLKALSADLASENFDPYLTAVGGSGLGILSPYNIDSSTATEPGAFTGPITPPETPGEDVSSKSLRERFNSITVDELGVWADQRGRWLFV